MTKHHAAHPAALATLLGLALMYAAPVGAQTADADGRLVYPAAFFATFSPGNALEIVDRVPGFVREDDDTEVRGFSQAAGNVVINGQRPSSKTDTIETILARIPANRVLRVEVGSGERFGSEYSAKAQVLNLVLSEAGGFAGALEAGVRRDFTGRVLPEGSASALFKTGRSTFNLAAAVENEATSEEGFDRVTSLPSGVETEYRRKVNRIKEPIASVSGSWAFDDGANRTAHLNARYGRDTLVLDQTNAVFPASGPIRDDSLTQRYRLREFEIGGDISRPFAGGGLKLIGLATRRKRHNADVIVNRASHAVIGGSEQTLADRRDETLGRLVWNRSNLGGWSVELGGEAVLNKLDSDVGLFETDEDGVRTRIDLPIDQAVVKERRAELFANAGRPLTGKLRLDLGLTYEASRLTVTGDAEARRTLSFLKPKATLDWRPGGGWHAQLSLERTVAQLQFGDFISSATLSSGQVNGGNANLVPQRAWQLLATIERPILGDGLVKLELGYDRISKLQDRVPTPEGFDAPGNLGTGEDWIARAKIDAPLRRFGIKGGRLTLYASYVGSAVEDPYTFRKRAFSGNSPFLFEVEFRQDLGRFAWGFEVEGSLASTIYRREELDRTVPEVPDVSAFVEYRPTARTTISFELENLTQARVERRRTFFDPDRTSPLPSEFELRRRNQHIVPYLKIKHSFG